MMRPTFFGSISGGGRVGPPTAGLYIDYDPVNLTLSNNDPIVTLIDSVAGRNATGATGKPTYITNAINTTLPVIQFDEALDQYFVLPSLAALTAGTIHIVFKNDVYPNTGAVGAGLWKMGTVADNTYFLLNSTLYDAFGSTTRHTVGDPAVSLSSQYRIYSVYSAPNDWQAYLDGVSLFADATNTVGFPAVPWLGQNQDTLNQYSGRIARFLLYSEKQSAPDFAATILYLQTAYGL